MKKKRLLLAVTLIVTMLASLSGCKDSKPTEGTDDSTTTTLKNANFTFLSQEKEELMRDPVKYPVFAAAIKSYEEKYHGKIEFIYSPYAEKQGKLSALMAAGTPPDLYQPIDGYPQFAINGYAQPIDDIINLKDPVWKDVKDAYDATEWKGKHNFVVVNKGAESVCWYNKSLFENNGLETPYELYKKGNWNWNTFRDAAIKLTQDTDGDKVIDQWGYSCGPEAIIGTTGQDLVKIKGKEGAIENNLKNSDVVNAFTFFQESSPAKYNIIQPDLNAYMNDFAKGKLGMFIGATWADTVWWKDLMKKGECSFVPAPKYPNSSDYYVGGSAEIWMIPKGATNPKAVGTFLTELRKSTIDPQIQKTAEEGNVTNRGWKDQELEMIKELKKLKYTYSFFAGVGNCGSDRWGFWGSLRVGGVPVQTEIEKHYNVWNNEIDIATGKVKLQHNEVAAASGTPKIDGDIEDAWKNAQEIVTDQEKSTPDIAAAKVKLLYDADTLYVLAQVSDKKIMSDNSNAYECDSVEIFVDENKAQGNGYDSNTVQLRVGADGKMSGGGAGWEEGKRASALTSAVKKVEGGYIVEAAYKFKSVKAKAGLSMGFNVSVNDEEETGKKKGTSIWNPDSGTSYTNPSRFGIVNFK
jgi:ABC-type glycerol-3-phosphate transport system substrate-binding protein